MTARDAPLPFAAGLATPNLAHSVVDGVNDPFTPSTVPNALGSGLFASARRCLPGSIQNDSDSVLRLAMPATTSS
ncbi:MAG TPA: hypothetical protein VGB55_07115, partial [Tepidisphaeraceae bacterium]